jgi:ricin-type beta-trefoil lectin protein
MGTKTSSGLLAAAAALTMGVALLSGIGSAAAAAKTLTVDLSSGRGPATFAGEGFLCGMNADASLPADQLLQPLGVTAWRAGGHLNRAYGQGRTNGTNVIIWDCNSRPNQQWNVNSDGTITGVQSGLCLDANGSGTTNATKIILWSCHGGGNQQWSLRN